MAEEKWTRVEPEEKEYDDEDYEADRVWDAFRDERQLDLNMYTTPDQLITDLQNMFTDEPTGEGIQGSVGKFGERGRALLIEQALEDWEQEIGLPEKEAEKEVEIPEEREAVPRKRKKVPPEERPSLPEPTIPTPYARPMEVEVTEVPKEELGPIGEPAVRPPVVRVPKPKVPVPVVPPAPVIPVVETPSQRIIRIINDLTRGISQRATPQAISSTVSSAGARVRDAVTDSVNWIRDRIRSLGGG